MSSGWFSFTPVERDPADEQAAWDALWPEPVAGDGPLNRFTMLRFHVAADEGEEEPFFAASDLVVPVIDGTPFFEVLSGGGWPGIPDEWLQPPYRQWPGSPEEAE